ncbi:hypothetical protein GCM10009565_40290 [Amycolatopsis albidoflavus]
MNPTPVFAVGDRRGPLSTRAPASGCGSPASNEEKNAAVVTAPTVIAPAPAVPDQLAVSRINPASVDVNPQAPK